MLRRFRLVHLIARIPAIAFATLICASVYANPRQRDAGFDVAAKYLDKAESLGVTLPKSQNNVVLFARFSPGRLDLIAQTRNKDKTYELACLIENSLHELRGKRVEYSTSGVFGMVRARRDNTRLFANYAEMTLPVARLFAELAQKGWQPQIVVEARNVRPLMTQPSPDRIDGKYRYWIVRIQTEAKDIVAQETIPAVTYLPHILLPISVVILLWGFVQLRKTKQPFGLVKQMRPFFIKVSIAVILFLISGLTMITSTADDYWVLADAWISPTGIAIVAAIVITAFFLGFAAWNLYSLRPKLNLPFIASAGHKDRLAELERIRKRSALQAIAVVFIVVIAFAALAMLISPPGSPTEIRKAVSWSMRIMMIAGITAGLYYRSYLIRKWSPKVSDPELSKVQEIVAAIAAKLAMQAPQVSVSSEEEDNLLVEAYYDSSDLLVVTRGAVLDLTDSELNALILLEMSTKSLETPDLARILRKIDAVRTLYLAAAILLGILLLKEFMIIVIGIIAAHFLPPSARTSSHRYTNDGEAFAKSLGIEPRSEIWTSLMEKQARSFSLNMLHLSRLPFGLHGRRIQILKGQTGYY